MNSLIGKVLKQNKRGGVTTRARKHLPIVRAEPSVIHGAGETANRTELQLRDSFFVFGRELKYCLGGGKNTKVPWNRSHSSTLSPQQSSSLGETKWDAVFFSGS
jgi:hypothetical protein